MRILINPHIISDESYDVVIKFSVLGAEILKHPLVQINKVYRMSSIRNIINNITEMNYSDEFIWWLRGTKYVDITHENFEQLHKEYKIDIHNKLTPLILYK